MAELLPEGGPVLGTGKGQGGRSWAAVLPSPTAQRKQAPRGGAGRWDHTKAPTTACAACLPLTPLPIRMQQGPQPLKGAFSSLTALSHPGLTQQLGNRPFSPELAAAKAPSWGIKPPLASPNTEAPAGRELSPQGQLMAASWKFPLLPEGRGCLRGSTEPPGKLALCRLPLSFRSSPEERLSARQLCMWLRQQPLPGLCACSASDDIRMLWSMTEVLLSCPSLQLEGLLPLGHRLLPTYSPSCPRWALPGGGREPNRRHPPPLPSGRALPEGAMSQAAPGAIHTVGIMEANCPRPERQAGPQVPGRGVSVENGLPEGALDCSFIPR